MESGSICNRHHAAEQIEEKSSQRRADSDWGLHAIRNRPHMRNTEVNEVTGQCSVAYNHVVYIKHFHGTTVASTGNTDKWIHDWSLSQRVKQESLRNMGMHESWRLLGQDAFGSRVVAAGWRRSIEWLGLPSGVMHACATRVSLQT